eukprot:SAG31_NODE_4231_length_3436_cov_6.237938_2_plen_135_part_00
MAQRTRIATQNRQRSMDRGCGARLGRTGSSSSAGVPCGPRSRSFHAAAIKGLRPHPPRPASGVRVGDDAEQSKRLKLLLRADGESAHSCLQARLSLSRHYGASISRSCWQRLSIPPRARAPTIRVAQCVHVQQP